MAHERKKPDQEDLGGFFFSRSGGIDVSWLYVSRGSAEMLEEGINHLDDGALLDGGELFDLLEPLQEARGAGPHGLGDGRETEELIGRNAQRFGEGSEHRLRRLGGVALVVGDHAIGEPDEGAQILLRAHGFGGAARGAGQSHAVRRISVEGCEPCGWGANRTAAANPERDPWGAASKRM